MNKSDLMGLLQAGAMEASTPMTYTNNRINVISGHSSSSSNRSGSSLASRHGGVVTCIRGGVQIKLGSSPNLALQPPHHQNDRPPHQLHHCQQQDADGTQEQASRDADSIRQRTGSPLRHVQPSAPGQQTLLRSWRSETSVSTSTSEGQPTDGEEGGQTNAVEAVRPPPFNPDCSASTHAESRPADRVEPTTGVKSASGDESQPSGAGSITSTPSDDRNALPPPSYDEIYGGQRGQPCQDYHQKPQQQEQRQQMENLFQTSSVTGTATDETVVCSSCLPCIATFGQYTDPGTLPQPGLFTHPTRISVRLDQTDQPDNPAVVVTDPSTSTVQVFTSKGDCLSVLRVPKVNGGCLIGQQSPQLLLLAVGTSVAVYEMDGRLVKEIPLTGRQQDAAVLTAVPYGELGFVAVRSRSLSICRGGITRPAVVRTVAGRYRADRGTAPFVNVVDVAVDSRRGCLVVLDAADPSVPRHRTAAYVMTEDGAALQSIRPTRDPRCGAMVQPFGVAVDREGNVLLSHGGRLVQFSGDDGRYLATLIGDDNATEHGRRDDTEVRGIAVGSRGAEQLVFALLTGVRFAQIRAFSLIA